MPFSRSRPGRWQRLRGGHVLDGAAVASLPDAIRDSAFPVAADCFLAALTGEEFHGVMMRVNHSCEPNVGMGGNVVLLSMRDIAAGEELTIDYALFLGDPGFVMECQCGTVACRVSCGERTAGAPMYASATGAGSPGGFRRPGQSRTARVYGPCPCGRFWFVVWLHAPIKPMG
jgi:hypothetical protein